MLIVFRLLAVLLLRLARVFTVAFLLLLLFRYDLLLTRLELLALPQVAYFSIVIGIPKTVPPSDVSYYMILERGLCQAGRR